ncbi:type I-E CRISPR-associated protein Cas6/Cse3/CasE [Pusillimonas sp. TS35]|nr:type I-E CRISPR-associated protein Cas6/Cse3/CasE [Pusillimonas sp. TS35]
MSHYFSRVTVADSAVSDPWFQAQLLHGEAYRDHALIWRMFPGDGKERDFIFRSHQNGRQYWVVSARKPEPVARLLDVESKAYRPKLAIGDRVHFDLRANPVVAQIQQGRRSKRHDIFLHLRHSSECGVKAEELEQAGLDWLLARASGWGLDVITDSVSQNGYCQHRLRHKGRKIAYSSLDYQGQATVTDPDRLRASLLAGVGHAKGFGCGLLLVRRLE